VQLLLSTVMLFCNFFKKCCFASLNASWGVSSTKTWNEFLISHYPCKYLRRYAWRQHRILLTLQSTAMSSWLDTPSTHTLWPLGSPKWYPVHNKGHMTQVTLPPGKHGEIARMAAEGMFSAQERHTLNYCPLSLIMAAQVGLLAPGPHFFMTMML